MSFLTQYVIGTELLYSFVVVRPWMFRTLNGRVKGQIQLASSTKKRMCKTMCSRRCFASRTTLSGFVSHMLWSTFWHAGRLFLEL